METKKSEGANLEAGRGQRLLLGLVVALACLFVGLEFSLVPDDPLDDPELLAMLDNDAELPPMLQPENELILAPKAEPRPQMKLVVVDDEEASPLDEDDDLTEGDAPDDMEAMELEGEMEPPPPPDKDALNMDEVDDLPQFPGGIGELMKWLTRNLKYPKALEQQKVQGRVVAEFIINRDGSVTDVRVVSSLNAECDGEVLRVLRMMPRWTAGTMQGEPCRTKVCLPVVFKI